MYFMMLQIMLQFLADIKCTNKTVRRQYILNKVFIKLYKLDTDINIYLKRPDIGL